MLKINECGDVTQVVMGREVAGTVYYWTAAYLIDGLLVDTGCAYTADELSTFLQDKTVDCVVNTHHHEDHVGGNLALLKERGEIISAHHLAVPLINSKLPLREYQELVWGYPEPVHVKEVTGKLETSRYNFEVIDTPGHSPDHIVILEPEQGWCFCGDIFVSENQKVL
ncbi:MAG TPA: MBL fold metallo-hydrolase, partial [Candidatus Limnocylindrales bacterium]|nr:MBL fold metallo-hydrolase [Candidatus Limnocylindrales bacterium]